MRTEAKADITGLRPCGADCWPRELGAVRARPNQRSDFPEPGLLLFGLVTNAGGGLPSPPTAVTWQISSDPT